MIEEKSELENVRVEEEKEEVLEIKEELKVKQKQSFFVKLFNKKEKKKGFLRIPPQVIFFVIVILALIAIVVGLLMFLITSPGMIIGNLKKMNNSLGNYVALYFGVNSNKNIDSKQIFGTIDYIEDMGFDLKGYGFLTDYYTDINNSDVNNALTAEERKDAKVDENTGTIKDSDDNVLLAKSDFMFTYLCSDNYIYSVNNKNLVSGGNNGIWDSTFGGIKELSYVLKNLVFNHLSNFLDTTSGVENAWGRGLLNIYQQSGSIGGKGTLYAPPLSGTGAIKVDTDKKQLVFPKGELNPSSKKIVYNLEGWSGRYSMPIEFLISVHLATMMPDLAYDMATTFPTKANIILNPITDSTGSSSYQPYLSEVEDHWFRDIYFVINNDEFAKNNTNIVDYNYDYQVDNKERWTLYETFGEKDLDTEYSEYAKNHYGDYKYYILDNDGNYLTTGGLDIFGKNTRIVRTSNGYFIYLGDKNEAHKEGIIVGKKAVTLDISNDETFEDISWNKIGGNWTAYEIVEKWDGDIKQVGEAMRSETNPKIKSMFLDNTYFRYDGSVVTADAITALRKRIKNDYLGNTNEYGALNKLVTTGSQTINGENVPNTFDFTSSSGYNREYTAAELGLDDNNNKKYRVSDFTGQVMLNQDSLNAFTMLENIHTIDADYIYRDFKELVVELGYFDKQELTEETIRLLEWIVPETPSLKYPERGLDKKQVEYGTTIHSKGDVDAYQAYEGTKILDTIPQKVDVHLPDLTKSGFYKRSTGEITKPDGSYLPVAGDMFTIQTEKPDYKINGTNYEIAETAKTMWLNMAKVTDGVPYKQASSGFAHTFEESFKDSKKRNVNDAVFVAWVLREMGADVEELVQKLGNIRHPAEHYWEIFEPDWTNPHHVARVCVESLGGRIVYTYRDLQPGDILTYVYSEMGEYIDHIDIVGEQLPDGSYLTYGCGNIPDIGETYATNKIDEETFYKLPLCFGIRISEDEFTGYLGNEMVVSPVTGILLEYGTYTPEDKDSITGEEYRVNNDLKYGIDFQNSDKKLEKSTVSEKVGYAKILVLDKENYLYLEQSTNNKWSKKTGGESLVTENGSFRDTLVADEECSAVDKVLGKVKKNGGYDLGTKWNDLDQTVYAYKEFAENYEKGGIAGNIIIIDGFVCEEPDSKLKDITKEIPYEGDSKSKNEARITVNDYYKKITESNIDDPTIQLPSKYIEDDLYDLSSSNAMDKNKAEMIIKYNAAHSLYIEDIYNKFGQQIDKEPLIFIKEGTILGRTITDKELLESSDFRNGSYGTYEENREVSLNINKDGEDKIIGNYLRVMMRDQDKTITENIEDYYKLGDKPEYDWFSILLWEPHEAGGVDMPLEGPECFDSCTPGELAVGIAQWTDLIMHYQRRDGNGINALLKRMVKNDFELCWPLEEHIIDNDKRWQICAEDPFNQLSPSDDHAYDYLTSQIWDGDGEYWDHMWPGLVGHYDHDIIVSPYTGSEFGYGHWIYDQYGNKIKFIPDVLHFIYCRYTGNEHAEVLEKLRRSEFQYALSKVCEMDREKFFRMQRQFAKECFLEPIMMMHPWVADRPAAVQGVLMHWLLGGGDYEMRWLTEDMTDEEILLYVRNAFAELRTTMSDPTHNPEGGKAWSEPEIAFRLLDGTITKYEVEVWVRTGNSTILTYSGLDYRN